MFKYVDVSQKQLESSERILYFRDRGSLRWHEKLPKLLLLPHIPSEVILDSGVEAYGDRRKAYEKRRSKTTFIFEGKLLEIFVNKKKYILESVPGEILKITGSRYSMEI